MSKILTVIAREYLERVRSRSFVIGTVIGPLMMSMFIVIPMLTAGRGLDDARTVAVIDRSGLPATALADALKADGRRNVTLAPVAVGPGGEAVAVAEMERMIMEGRAGSGMLVPEDFIATGKASFYSKSVSAAFVRDDILKPALARVLREERFARAQVPDSLYTYLSGKLDWDSVTISEEGGRRRQNDAVSFGSAVVLIMIIYMMVLMYGNHTLTAVIEEKNSRMAEVLLSSVAPENLMLGKVMGIGLAGLTQFGIWAGTFFVLSLRGVTIGDMSIGAGFLTPVVLVSFVMFFLLGFFLYATLYAGIGAMCNQIQDAQQFNLPLMMGLIIPMTMMGAVIREPNSLAVTIFSLVPLCAPVLMFMRVCVETPPLWQVVLSWVLLAGSIWLAARGAGKLFRIGILMYGQSPTWATIGKALRS